MGFASPIWLLGLLPWVAVAIYVLPGRGRPAVVPFLGLWKGSASQARSAGRRWPRVAVVLAIFALLLAVLAAGRPVRLSGKGRDSVTIVLDRGATMSLPSASGKPFRNVIDAAASQLGFLSAQTRVTLVPAPGPAITTTGRAWQAAAAALSPTVIPVELDAVVAEQLRRTRGPVFVLSDQPLHLADPRIVQVFPEPAASSVAITAIGARLLPHPQVMVRLENHSDLSSLEIEVRSDDVVVRKKVPLPPWGQSGDRFFDLSALGGSVRARLAGAGDLNPWSQAFLVRQSNGVEIAVDSAMDPLVKRIAAIYSKNRAAIADAPSVIISNRPLQTDQAGIWIGASDGSGASGGGTVVPHAVTVGVRQWDAGNAAGVPAGFKPVVSLGSVTVVAVRDDSVRQVWLNADLRAWEKSPDFVVFFAGALDWIAGKEQSFQAIAPAVLGDDWHAIAGSATPAGQWPGIYQSTAGNRVAVNAGPFPNLDFTEKQQREVHALAAGAGNGAGEVSISDELLLCSLALLLMAAAFW
jgi:hypothetical protein